MMEVSVVKAIHEKVNLSKSTMQDVFMRVLMQNSDWQHGYYIRDGADDVLWDEEMYHGSDITKTIRKATKEDKFIYSLIQKSRTWQTS